MKYTVQTESGTVYFIEEDILTVTRFPKDPSEDEPVAAEEEVSPKKAGRFGFGKKKGSKSSKEEVTVAAVEDSEDDAEPAEAAEGDTNSEVADVDDVGEIASDADADDSAAEVDAGESTQPATTSAQPVRWKYLQMAPPVPIKGQPLEFHGRDGMWVTSPVTEAVHD